MKARLAATGRVFTGLRLLVSGLWRGMRAAPGARPASRPASRLLVAIVWLTAAPALHAESLSQALSTLASSHDFSIKGLARVQDEPAPYTFGDLREQLSTLLQDYDHVILGAPPTVRHIIILGPKADTPALMRVKTRRRNTQHFVDVTVAGPNGLPMPLALMVDTGASTLVLPASLIEPLGFEADTLPERRAQTVNGTIEGLGAELKSVRIDSAVQESVAVVFIDDDKLGEARLLGMSFLRHYRFTIDDAANELRLARR
ncbi:MAG: clan AA aspartic protease [Gammaproteobacteria bacterium]|nr:clan AA aspartic protease [Gammaproteobacteria bacterium]